MNRRTGGAGGGGSVRRVRGRRRGRGGVRGDQVLKRAAREPGALALPPRWHLGHISCSVGVSVGKSVAATVGNGEFRCEWTSSGDVVKRAERLAMYAESEVLCDLSVVRACGGRDIDFDPVPHAAGDDIARARNLQSGCLDRILRGRAQTRVPRRRRRRGRVAGSSPLGHVAIGERAGRR